MSTTTSEYTAVEYVDPCPGMKGDERVVETCGKCSGIGEVNYGNQFYATANGGSRRTCYDCNGTGKYVRLVKNIRAAERRRVREANRLAREVAEAAALRDEWAAAHADLAARLLAIRDETGNAETEMESYAAAAAYGDFITSLAHQSAWRPLTDQQVVAVTEALAKHDAKVAADTERKAKARTLNVPVDTKVTITGRVKVAMNVDGYAYGSTDRLLVIEGNGFYEDMEFKITGSGQTLWEPERGSIVEVAATVKKYSEYQGVPQTILTRAKVKVTAA